MSILSLNSSQVFETTNILKKLKVILPTIFSICILYYCFQTVQSISLRYTLALFSNISVKSLVAIILLFSLSFFIGALRLLLAYRQFDVRLSYPDVIKASFIGQVSGFFFVPFLGTIIGQSYVLRNHHIPSTITSVVCMYERLSMALSGMLIGVFLLSMMWQDKLFNLISLNKHAIEGFILFSGIILWQILKHRDLPGGKVLQNFFSLHNFLYFFGVFSLSVISWSIASLAFTIAILMYDPSASFGSIYAASLIVSFIASLPISFNGWGIREFAAIKVFGWLGIGANQSLIAAVSIGIMSLIALVPISFLVARIFKEDNTNKEINPKYSGILNEKIIDMNFIYIAMIVLLSLIFFNFRLSISATEINLNLADPIALCGFVFYLINIATKSNKITFTFPGFNFFITTSILSFLFSLLIGIHHFGFSAWAFGNKFIGWFILLGYACMGILFSSACNRIRFIFVADIMANVLALIILVKYVMLLLMTFDFLPAPVDFLRPLYWEKGFSGYIGNKNAFAFQIICVIGLLHVVNYAQEIPRYKILLLSILYAGAYFTYSRSGLVVLALLIPLLIFLKILKFREFVKIILTTFVFFNLIKILSFLTFSQETPVSMLDPTYSGDWSDNERWYTIVEGLKLWLENPFWGAGLGAFVHHEFLENHRFLMIHNIFVWILAEFGIIGSAAFIIFSLRVCAYSLKSIKLHVKKVSFLTAQDGILFCLLLNFLMMATVHDIMYQRIFWVLLGICLVKQYKEDACLKL